MRTSEDARLDPQPGDVQTTPQSTGVVTARDGDTVTRYVHGDGAPYVGDVGLDLWSHEAPDYTFTPRHCAPRYVLQHTSGLYYAGRWTPLAVHVAGAVAWDCPEGAVLAWGVPLGGGDTPWGPDFVLVAVRYDVG